MANITLRAYSNPTIPASTTVKNAALTQEEVDANFYAINAEVALKLPISSPTINGGTINSTPVGATTASTGAFTTLSASNTLTLTGAVSANTGIKNQTYSTSTGIISLTSGSAGSINNFNIGATTAGTGRFTTLTATSTVTLTTGTINGISIGATTASTGAFTTLVVAGGGVSAINNVPIGGTTASTGAFTSLNVTGAVSSATTINNQSYTTTTGIISLNSGVTGSINNFNIGATTAGTGAFTTLSANGDVNFSGTSALKLPAGTTAQRPVTGSNGMLRYSTTLNTFEGYIGDVWTTIAGSVNASDTSADNTFYPALFSSTSGAQTDVYVSSSYLNFNPYTGTLSSGTFQSLSDISLKTSITDINNALGIVNRLNGVEFEWKSNGQKSAGVIAQELETIIPHLVTECNNIKHVNYSGLIAYLINAIKDLTKQVYELKNGI